jgi:hypothetical protein
MAISALHMAYLKPEKRAYQILAAKHESLALPAIRVALQSIREQDCHALHACAQIFVKCALADISASANLLFTPEKDKVAVLVHLMRGAFAIRDVYFMWLVEGPLKASIQIPLDRDPSFQQNPGDLHLALLVPELTSRDPAVGTLCCQALNILRRLLAIIATPNQTISVTALMYWWPAQVPDGYIVLMNEKRPEALVVLAHYCVMLHQIGSHWYMDGCAKKLLLYCKRNLPTHWIRLIQEPLATFGID